MQKYSYVPAVSKVNEKVPFCGMLGEAIDTGPALVVTVCASLSRFVHVTVSPAATVRAAGLNAKLSMVTAWSAARTLAEPMLSHAAASMAKAEMRVMATRENGVSAA